ncbi:MAG: phosphatase PAP2 family protein [bacterium]
MHWIRRTHLALPALLVAIAFPPAAAQADTATRSTVQLFTYRDGALAAGVMLGALFARRLDEHYAHRLQDSSTQANARLHTLATFVRTTAAPGALIIGTSMYATGRLAKNDHLASLGLHGTEALMLGEVAGGVLKGFIGRQRPYVTPENSHSFGFMRGFGGGDKFRSFPSGHSLAAFAAAAAVSSETSGWWPNTRWIFGPALYAGATLTAVSRMYDNRHWASDVIVGGGLGTFAGLKVIRYNNAHPGNKLDRWLLTGSLIPTADGGHALRWSLVPGVSLGSSPKGP